MANYHTTGKHRAGGGHDRARLAGGALLGAVASGALAVGALGGAGTANATCASISGINNGAGCTISTASLAVGLGPNTTAIANGFFSTAVAIGLTNTGAQTTFAQSTGNF